MRADSTERMYKCAHCGHMYSLEDRNPEAARCPKCGNVCRPGECEVVDASNEDY